MKTRVLPPERLNDLAALLTQRFGVDYPPPRLVDLRAKVLRCSRRAKFQAPGDCVDWLLSGQNDARLNRALISLCTVGETYLFRDPDILEWFRESALPELIATSRAERRSIRIWSAGCCTGEEAYSLSIMLHQEQARHGEFAFEISGTDVNDESLEYARAANYGAWAFRTMKAPLRERYFDSRKKRFTLRPPYRENVRFQTLNLIQPSYPGIFGQPEYFDVIICRNVLMYFTEALARKAFARLVAALRPGGIFLTSGSESSITGWGGLCRAEAAPHAGRKSANTGKGSFPASSPLAANAPRDPIAHDKVSPPLPAPSAHAPLRIPAGNDDTKKPIHARPAIEIAVKLEAEGRFEDARTILMQNTGRDNDAVYWITLARLSQRTGAHEEARRCALRVLDADPLCAEAHRVLANALRALGTLDGALAALKHAVYLEPGSAEAHLQLGFVYRELEQARLSRIHFRNAAALLCDGRADIPLPELGDMSTARLADIALNFAEGPTK